MSPLIKRELAFWVTVVAAIAGYVALGQVLAPRVPPEPPAGPGGIIRTPGDVQRLIADLQQRNERRDAIVRHNAFLRGWYQWGAAVGLVLLLVYTLWRPPWRLPEDRTAKPARRKKPPDGG